jgi:Uma2 family endonuclease
MTYAEYLAAEARSEVRHEFLNGDVWAMAGGTPDHAALAAALIGQLQAALRGQLQAALRGQPCRVFTSDARVRVVATGLSTYPDVSVVCGAIEPGPEDADAITNPIILFEVLSDSTEAYDRGAKAAHYRRIPALREYVFLSQGEPRVEVFRRTDAGRWELIEARAGETIELASVPARLDVAALYHDPLRAPPR